MDHDLSPAYWNNRYLNNQFSWDTGAVSTPLKTYFEQIADKELFILIPGAGNAHEAEYLFSRGFSNVYICEVAEAPILNFLSRCPAFNKDRVLQVNFFELAQIRFDLIIEQTFFCALDPALRQAYFEKVTELLMPGGKLVGLLFDDPMNHGQPPFGGSKKEYLSYVQPPLRVLIADACYNSIKPRQGKELFIKFVKDAVTANH